MTEAINPALEFLPLKMDKPIARVMLLAIGLQATLFQHRQRGDGPGMGFWQLERDGGVKGVMTHPASGPLARQICDKQGVPFTQMDAWKALAHDDVLAAVFARLLLWTDRQALPRPDDAKGGWDLYLRTWRPDRPRPEKWAANFAHARGAGVPMAPKNLH